MTELLTSGNPNLDSEKDYEAVQERLASIPDNPRESEAEDIIEIGAKVVHDSVVSALQSPEGSEEEARFIKQAQDMQKMVDEEGNEIIRSYRDREIKDQLEADEQRRNKAREEAKPLFDKLGWDKRK